MFCIVLHLDLKFYAQKYPSDREGGEIINLFPNRLWMNVST